MTEAPARLMHSTTNMDIAYLQVENPIPASLPVVAIGNPSKPAESGNLLTSNPLIGQW